jgi:molybdate transport system substrate-binding protein
MRMGILAALAIALLALAPSCARAELTISAAISLKPALEKAQPLLEQAAGEKIAFNFGATGTLARQIQQGQGVDLFLAADRLTVQKLLDAKAAETGTDQAFAGNELVLIYSRLAPAARPKPAGFADLLKVRKLAIGDPQVVPAGTYARDTLTQLKLYDELQKAGQLVTAENVAQVLSYVQHGDADAGIVYASDAKAAGGLVEVIATADPATHGPIEYVSVLVSASGHRAAAAGAQQALAGDKVQAILRDFGFTPPPTPPAVTQPAATRKRP